jgi:hypothetical protein
MPVLPSTVLTAVVSLLLLDLRRRGRTRGFELMSAAALPRRGRRLRALRVRHYIENLGTEPLVFLEMFRNPRFEDISATQWMANTPAQVSADTLNMPRRMIEALPKEKHSILPATR